jgi:hypothetical protein
MCILMKKEAIMKQVHTKKGYLLLGLADDICTHDIVSASFSAM